MIENIQQHEYNIFQYFYLIGVRVSKTKLFPDNITSEVISKYPNVKLPYLNIPDEIIINFTFPTGLIISEKEPRTEFYIFSLDNTTNKTTMLHKKIHFGCLAFPEQLVNVSNNKSKSQTPRYAQKALVLCSFQPFYIEMHMILMKLYVDMTNNQMPVSIEKAVHSIIFDIPSPPPGIFKVEYLLLNTTKIIFNHEPINKIPTQSIDFKAILLTLNINHLIRLIKCILLEIPIIIFSEDKHNLSNIIEGLVSLIYPFKYPHPVIALLPVAYYSSIQYFKTFIIGINEKYVPSIFELNKINIKGKSVLIVELNESANEKANFIYLAKNVSYCIITFSQLSSIHTHVNCESESLSLSSNIVTNWNNSINQLSPSIDIYTQIYLPKYYTTKMAEKIYNCFWNKKGEKKTWIDNTNLEMSNIFYSFFISLFLNYQQFLVSDEKEILDSYAKIKNGKLSINSLFKSEEFYLSVNSDDFNFFLHFFQTKVWQEFLMRKFYPNAEEKMEILLFDEMIFSKKNRNIKQIIKYKIPFIELETFNIKDTISINQINKDDKPPRYDNFPKLAELKQGFKVQVKNLYEAYELETLLIVKNNIFSENYNLFGYNLNIILKIQPDMEKYIMNLWFRAFSLTFWYVNAKEKWHRFNQMISLLATFSWTPNSNYIDESICNELLLAIITYGDKQMASVIFSYLPHRSFFAYTLLNYKLLKTSQPFNQYNFTKQRNLNPFSPNDQSPVEMITKSQCDRCSTEFDIRVLSTNFKDMNKESIYYTCSKCSFARQAYLKIKADKDKIVQINLSSPMYLFNCIKKIDKIQVKNFYSKNKELFWNMVWFFSLKGLTYDFLFPYQCDSLSFKYETTSLSNQREICFDLIQEKEKSNDAFFKGVEMFFQQRSKSNARQNETFGFNINKQSANSNSSDKNEHSRKGLAASLFTFRRALTNNTQSKTDKKESHII